MAGQVASEQRRSRRRRERDVVARVVPAGTETSPGLGGWWASVPRSCASCIRASPTMNSWSIGSGSRARTARSRRERHRRCWELEPGMWMTIAPPAARRRPAGRRRPWPPRRGRACPRPRSSGRRSAPARTITRGTGRAPRRRPRDQREPHEPRRAPRTSVIPPSGDPGSRVARRAPFASGARAPPRPGRARPKPLASIARSWVSRSARSLHAELREPHVLLGQPAHARVRAQVGHQRVRRGLARPQDQPALVLAAVGLDRLRQHRRLDVGQQEDVGLHDLVAAGGRAPGCAAAPTGSGVGITTWIGVPSPTLHALVGGAFGVEPGRQEDRAALGVELQHLGRVGRQEEPVVASPRCRRRRAPPLRTVMSSASISASSSTSAPAGGRDRGVGARTPAHGRLRLEHAGAAASSRRPSRPSWARRAAGRSSRSPGPRRRTRTT